MVLIYNVLSQVWRYLDRRSRLNFLLLDKRIYNEIHDDLLRENVQTFLRVYGFLPKKSLTRAIDAPYSDEDRGHLASAVPSSSNSDTSVPETIALMEDWTRNRNKTQFRGYALPYAIIQNQPHLLRQVLELAGPLSLEVKTPNDYKHDPLALILTLAVENSAIDSIKILLDEVDGIREAIQITDGLALAAVRLCDNDMVKLLIQAGASTEDNVRGEHDLGHSANCASMIELLVELGVELNVTGRSKALHWHVSQLHAATDFVTALVHGTRDVDAIDGTGEKARTALNCASCCLNIRAIRTLLNLGADAGGSVAYEPISPVGSSGSNNWKGSTPLQDVLAQDCRAPGPQRCTWAYHLHKDTQARDIADVPEMGDSHHFRRLPFTCYTCERCPSPISYLMRWVKQIKLLAQRMLAAVEMLINHGAGEYINIRRKMKPFYAIHETSEWLRQDKTAFECLMHTVRQIIQCLRDFNRYALSKHAPSDVCHKIDEVPTGRWVLDSEYRWYFEEFGIISDLLIEAGAELPVQGTTDASGLECLLELVDLSTLGSARSQVLDRQ